MAGRPTGYGSSDMFEVTVSDHMMVAHSLPGEVFGPAQALHGATYVVEAAFARQDLDDDGIVLDIGRALDALKGALSDLTYRNLDEVDSLAGLTTTTEVLCREIADRLAMRVRDGSLGASATDVQRIRVTLRESPVAWASYERAP
jgi:6-pyruvoyl-tetrahydropterin synthase